MSASDNLWIAGGGGYYAGNLFATSTDGITWTRQGKNNFGTNVSCIERANGMFVAVGYDSNGTGSKTAIATSTDGITWTSRIIANYTLYSVAYGNGLWIAGGSFASLKSTDGITWTAVTMKSNQTYCVAYANGLWVAGGAGGNSLASSTDGISWTGRGSSVMTSVTRAVAYANNLWIAVGEGSNHTATSTDGINWTGRGTLSGFNGVYAVAYGNGLWVIGGSRTSSGYTIATSTDGITWTGRGIFTGSIVYGVAYSNGLWVATGSNDLGPTFATSTNGTTWTNRTTGFQYPNETGFCVAGPNLPTTLSNFTVASRALGSGNFTITAPTTNSNGTFSYTSSNTAVATIAGNTVTMVGKGSTTITATQSNTKQFQTGTISTVFGVYIAGSYTANNVNYTYYDGLGTATVTTSSSATGDINILTTFDVNGTTYTVTSIAASAFSSRPITSVTIPNTVTSIGASAFWTTNIASVTIPASVTSVGTNAFGNCVNLATIVVNAYISNLASAFTYMNASLAQTWTFDYAGAVPGGICAGKLLSSVTIGNTITGIEGGVFQGCTGLTSISLPSTITSIGLDAFRDCTWLTSITIPNAVTVIGGRCFMGCTGLTSFTIPSGTTLNPTYGVYGESVFIGCTNLTTFNIYSYVSFIGGMLTGFTTPNITMTFNYVGAVPDIAFQNSTLIKTVVIGDLITSIGYGAFYMNSNITSLTLGSSLTLIGQGAFSGCTKITSITLPSSLVTIQDNVFASTQISTISFPASLTALGGNAFGGCTALTSVTIPPTLTTVGSNAFTGCTSLRTIVVQKNLTGFAGSFPTNNTNTSVTFDYAGLIPASACTNKTGITSLIIGNSITGIGTSAFSGCTGLTNIIIPASVTSIGASAFNGCSNLNTVSFLGAIPTIGSSNFTSATDTAFYKVDATTNTNPTTVNTNLSMFTTKTQIGIASPTITNFVVPSKRLYDPSFILVDPSSNSSGSFVYSSSDTSVATINGNVVTILSIGTAVITATQQIAYTSGFNYTEGTITASLVVNKAMPNLGTLSIANKTASDAPFAIAEPTKPANHTGTWSYSTTDTDKITVSENMVTILAAGLVRVSATLSSDSLYEAKTIFCQFSIAEAGSSASSFTYTETSTVVNVIPSTVQPVANTVTLSPTLFSSSLITQLNPTTGTDAEKVENRNLISQILFANFPTATTVVVPKSIIYLPTAIKQTGVTTVTVLKTDATTSESPLILSTANLTQDTVFFSEFNNVGNSMKMNGSGSFAGYSVKITKDTGDNYIITKTDNLNVVTTSTSVKGDVILYAGFKLVLGSVTGQLFDPNPVITNFTMPTKTFGDAAFTIVAPTSNSDGAFLYTSSNTSVATIAGNVVTIVGAGTSTITATQESASYYNSGTTTASFVVNKATPTQSNFSIPAKVFSDAPFTITAPTSNSTGAFTYSSSNTAVATVAGNTITIVGVGTSTITASQAASTNYLAKTITATFTTSKGTPVLTNFSIPTKFIGNSAFTITAPTSNSTGAFTYTSSNTAVATVAGSTITIVGIGMSTITATQAATTNFLTASTTALFTVNNTLPSITNFSVPTKTFGDAPFTIVTPTSTSTGAFTYSSSNTSVATIAGNVITIVGGGTATITATQASTSNYTTGTATTTLTVNKATTVVSNFAAVTKTFGDAPFAIAPPTTNSNGVFSYSSSNTNVATIAGDVVTIVGAGSATITATQAMTASFTSATITTSMTVSQGVPILANFNPITKVYGDAPFTIVAPTTNSTGAFTYTSSNTAVATIVGNVVTIIGLGSSTITATQASTANSLVGTITTTLQVNRGPPTLTNFSITDKTIGTQTFTITPPTSNSDGAFIYTSSNTTVAKVNGNKITVTALGSATITAVQAETALYLSGSITSTFQVNPLATTLTILPIPAKKVGDIPFKIQGSSNSGSPIVYSSSDTSVLTIAGDTATIVGGGSVIITASQEANGTYGSATTTYELQISATLTVLASFSVPVSTVGNAPFVLVAPQSNRPGAFIYDSSNTDVATIVGNTVTIVGAGVSTIIATQTGTSSYTSASITATLIVNPAVPTLTNFSVSAKVVGDAPFTLTQPTSTSPGAFTYTSSNLLVATVAGNVVTIVGTGTCTISAIQASTPSYTAATATASLVVTKATTNLSNFAVPAKTFGDAPFTLTPPTTNSNGSITYTSSNTDVATIVKDVVTIVGLGSTTITVNQATTANYTAASTSATLTVIQGASALTHFTISPKTFGDAAFSLVAPRSNSDGAFTYTSSNLDVATIVGNTITIVGAGSTTITATQAATTNFASAFIAAPFQINRITTQLSSFVVPVKTFGDAAFALVEPTTNSPGAFSYSSSNTAVATIAGNMVTIVGGGNATITATQEQTTNYSSATITATLQVSQQKTNLSNFVVSSKIIGDANFVLAPPTTNSNGAITYTSSDAAVATVQGSTVTIVGLGSTVITASQASTASFSNASIVATLRVGLITTALSNFVIPAKSIGDAPFNLDPPTSNSSGAFSYTTSNALVATVAGDVVTVVGTGTATITATQASTFNSTGATITASLVVNKAETVMTNFILPDKIFGEAPFVLTPPTTNSNGPITYTSSDHTVATILRNVVTIVGIGTTTITATQPATANYTAGTISDALSVSQASPTITNFVIPAKNIGDAPFTLVAPTSNSTGAFTYTSSDETIATIQNNEVTIVGGGTVTITATQDETANFTWGDITAVLSINKIPTVLSNFAFPSKTFGDEDFALTPPTSNSDGPITYTSSNEEVAIISEEGVVMLLGGGSTTITAVQESTPTYRSATISALLKISPQVTILSDFSVPTKIIGDPAFTLDPPNSTSNGEMVYTSTNPAVATIEGDVVTIVGLGNTTIVARQLGTNDYTSDSITALFQVKLIRTVLSNFVIPSTSFGSGTFTLTPPTTNSSGAFSYTSSNLLVATIAGNVVTIVGTGTVVITANQESTENSTAARITSSLVVNRALNTISSFSIPEKTTDTQTFVITPPVTSSNGAFTYTSSDPTVATVQKDVITIMGTGTATITAIQAATANYTSATITATLTVNQGSPGLKNFNIPVKTVGDAPFALTAPTTKSSGAISYVSSDTSVATIVGDTVTILAPGTSTITATQESTPIYVSTTTTALLTVNKITTALTNFAIPAKTFGDAAFAIVAPTTNNSDGAFTYTSSNTSVATVDGNNTVTIVGGGTAIITATQAATTNYTSASTTTLLQVNLARTVLSNFSVPARIIGEAPFALVPPTTNSNGEFTYTSTNPAVATVQGNMVTIVGLGSTTIIANQARTTNYTSANTTAPLQVNLITTVLSNFSMPTKVPSDAPFQIEAPTSNSTGAFTYTSSNTLVATIVGNTVTIVGVGFSIITAVQASTPNSTVGTTTATLVVNKTTATLSNFTVPEKVFGNAPFVLVAPTTNSNGSFTYTSSDPTVATIAKNMVTIVGVGTATITANLPSTANFTAGTTTATLTVGKGAAGLNTFAVPAKTFGDSSFQIVAPQSSSTGAISYTSSNTDVATIDGNTVTIVGGGSATITATQESTSTYNSDTITAVFQVNKAVPVQTDFSLPSKAAGDAPFSITPPTSNSNGAFTYTSSNTAVATIDGDVITVVGGGTSTITATQASTASFLGKAITAPFQVSALTTVLSNFSIPTRAMGDAAFAITPPTTNGDGVFTYTSSNTSIATIAGNMVTIVGAGSCTITARQSSTSNYSAATITALFLVNKGTPVIANFVMPLKEIGMADFTIVNPASTSNGEFTYTSGNTAVATIFKNTVSVKTIGTSVITMNQLMTSNYLAATATATFTVQQMSPTITGFVIPATKTVGDKTIKIAAPKSNSISKFVFASSNDAVAKVAKDVITIIGAGTVTITATQPATKSFGPGVVSAVMQVNKKVTFLTNFAVFPKIVGAAPFTIVPPTTSGNGAFTYTSSNPDVATIAGNVITVVGAGTSTITASQASTANFTDATISTTFVVSLPSPVIGTLPIANKSLADAPFTIIDPSKPADSTTSWVYTSSNTDVATINGNDVTILQPGFTTIVATLPADSVYNSATLMTQFSVADPPSTFVFITSSAIQAAIPTTVLQTINTVIPTTVASPVNIGRFNPTLGTIPEKIANRFMVVNTLLNMFPRATTINIPTTLLYVPLAFNKTKLKNIKLIRPYGVDATLVINTLASDSAVGYVCSILDVGNSVRLNGVGAMLNNFIVITRGADNKYLATRTTKTNVSTSTISMAGDIISFANMTVMIV
jgi:hypothetical protein